MATTDTVAHLASALYLLADQLEIDGQGADTLPAKDTAAKVRALADRAFDISQATPATWPKKGPALSAAKGAGR